MISLPSIYIGYVGVSFKHMGSQNIMRCTHIAGQGIVVTDCQLPDVGIMCQLNYHQALSARRSKPHPGHERVFAS